MEALVIIFVYCTIVSFSPLPRKFKMVLLLPLLPTFYALGSQKTQKEVVLGEVHVLNIFTDK